MKKKKKIFISLFIIIILSVLIFSLKSIYKNQNSYDISRQGSSETKGKFIPEKNTDYIFTTIETENNLYKGIIILCPLIIIINIIVNVRKKNQKKFKF